MWVFCANQFFSSHSLLDVQNQYSVVYLHVSVWSQQGVLRQLNQSRWCLVCGLASAQETMQQTGGADPPGERAIIGHLLAHCEVQGTAKVIWYMAAAMQPVAISTAETRFPINFVVPCSWLCSPIKLALSISCLVHINTSYHILSQIIKTVLWHTDSCVQWHTYINSYSLQLLTHSFLYISN